jgi:hypothetical protein
MFGKYRQEAPTNLRHNFYVAQNVTTRSENTAKTLLILNLVVEISPVN